MGPNLEMVVCIYLYIYMLMSEYHLRYPSKPALHFLAVNDKATA